MKKLIAYLCFSLTTLMVNSQGVFAVPTPTDTQKYQLMSFKWNISALNQISFAKSIGKTAEDIGKFVGEQNRALWNKDAGFNGFVEGILNTFVALSPYGTVEIIEQTNNKVVLKVTQLYAELKEKGTIYNITYGEYLKFLETIVSRLSEFMGSISSFKDTDSGLLITLQKQ